MANYKTVPNQKVVKVNKEKCDKAHLYAAINLEAMEKAAQALDAGAFKLWCYFAKNQSGFTFALSSKTVQETFGIKIRQYNSAVEELIKKGYLVRQGESNIYCFNEIAVDTKCNNESETKNSLNTKCNNDVITKCNNAVNTKCNKDLLQNVIRNTTNTTLDNTKDNTEEMVLQPAAASTISLESQKVEGKEAQIMTTQEASAQYGLAACANRVAAGIKGCYWIDGNLVKLL